jgi:short-subunit dehydrogenase
MPRNHTVIEAGMTALVTGASSGIGEQFARQLADRGVHLVLIARDHQRLEDLATDLRRRHDAVTVTVHTADLAEAVSAGEVAAKLTSDSVTVDVLVNNAGVGSHGRFVDQDPGAIIRLIQLNCTSLVALTRQLLPAMVTRRRGGIINVASTAGFQPIPTMAVYAASKAFVLSFTEALWAETEASGVRVMALCPGATETRFFETANPTKQFMTRGRQSPDHVAEVALRKFDTSRGPSVIPGVANRLLATGYRVMPRAVMARMAERNVRAK